MNQLPLPIVHMTLYKHGVGYYRRRGPVEGEAVKLTFRREEMDDLLKSLTVIDHSGGQVRGIDYDTPQSQEERLAGCSVILDKTRSLRDLLMALRGRAVKLRVTDGSNIEGTLLGLDETEEKPLKWLQVSILQKETETTSVVPLNRLESVEIHDTKSAADLRFFLETAQGQETHRSITIRLSPGRHDLEVSYIAPAPGWRVSYRLVMDNPQSGGPGEETPEALMQGWGIFDNRLEEDLSGISLSLTAGMPISFVYNLYTPHTAKRPVVKDEERVAAAPIMFEEAEEEVGAALADMQDTFAAAAPPPMAAKMMETRGFARPKVSTKSMAASVESAATGEGMGELFQYNVNVPVTVGRGQSAMVPIVSSRLHPKKDLIYNRAKMETHPVATLRFKNITGLTLERGPVTVLENGEYVGEAVLPFTTDKAEAIISYAIELGVHIKEHETFETQLHSLYIKNGYLVQQRYDIRRTRYRVDNRTPESKTILIERSLDKHFVVFDTPEPAEKTLETLRFKLDAPPGKIIEYTVQERFLKEQREGLRSLSYRGLKKYFEDKFLDKHTYESLKDLLNALAEVSKLEKFIAEQEKQRKEIYAAQDQIQKKMGVLAKDGEEGRLRGRYVQQLTQHEEFLAEIDKTIANARSEIEKKQKQIEQMIAKLGK